MNDSETIMECLNVLDPSILDYDDWLRVGMVLHNKGGTVEQWDSWSARDSKRYNPGECERKWRGFSSSGDVGIGSLVELCRSNGYKLNVKREAENLGRSLDFDAVIGVEKKHEPQLVTDGLIQMPKIPDDWDGVEDFRKFMTTLFDSSDHVCIVADATRDEEKDRWYPKRGDSSRTVGQILRAIKKGDLGAAIGDIPEGCGAWFRVNPLDGSDVKDSNVVAFKYVLVESDTLSVEQQYTVYKDLELPIATLVHSGGKSLHALVKVDAKDINEYRARVNFLYDTCKKNGLQIDKANRNPSRLSRLAGVMRGTKPQWLIATHIGKSDWNEWKEFIDAQTDDLPDVESLAEFIANPPAQADSLIDGVLRKGHKMLVSGPSKAGKTWLLLQLAAAIASGRKWLDWQCEQGKVMYVNLELDRASCLNRLRLVFDALGIPHEFAENIELWHLRGRAMPLDKLAPKLIRRAMKKKYAAIVIDPIYKVITGDENSADQMANFCNQFDKICGELGSSVIYCHHHSKGSQGQKRSHDRASGSGVFARDPDALIDIIELQVSDKCRDQIINRWGIDALEHALNKRCKGWGQWIDIDEVTDVNKLVDFAVNKLGEEEAYRLVNRAEELANNATCWRIGGILREYPAFKPVNVFFSYPIHPLDHWGLLKDCLAEGEEPPRKRREAIAHKRNPSTDSTMSAFYALSNGGEKVKVQELASYLNLSVRATYTRLSKTALIVKDGFVTKQ